MDVLVLISVSVSFLLHSFHGSSSTSFGQSCTCDRTGGCSSTYQCEPPHSCRKGKPLHQIIKFMTENIALGKEASFTSVWKDDLYPACLALNGNTNRAFARINSTNPNCANSGDNINSTWQVDLGNVYAINSITIYTMETYEMQMSGVLITVDNNNCYDISTIEKQSMLDLECKAPLRGRFIKFLKHTPSKHGKYLSFCEVQVWVCISGYYGRNCENSCGKCVNGPTFCDPVTGNCSSGCQIGWQHPLCKETCISGYYGRNCENSCGKCLHGPTFCDSVTGNCSSGCQIGWQPPSCKGICISGYYGRNCEKSCGKCLHGPTFCDPVTGNCNSGCQIGWQPPLCKEICISGYYGRNCENSCGKCVNGPTFCDPITGNCSSGCQIGWEPPLCKETCISGYYGRNCENSCGKCINGQTFCDPVTGNCSFCDPVTGNCSFCDPVTGNCSFCDPVTGNCSFCDPVTGNCSSGCQIVWQPPLCMENSLASDPLGIFNWSLIGGMICGFVALCIMLSVIVVLKLSRRQSQSADNSRSTGLALQTATTMQTLEVGQLRSGDDCGNVYYSLQREDQSAEYCYTSFISEERKSQTDCDDHIYANVVATGK